MDWRQAHPTAEWLSRQITEAFPWDTAPAFLIRDNDSSHGEVFTRRLRSGVFIVHTSESISRVFFITAATFGAMSLFGYTTRSDLSRFGSLLFMGLIGIIIASLVNMFLVSSALQFAISVIGVIVFVSLTAYDTQRIKEIYAASDDTVVAGKKAIMGALALYLDFLNLFLLFMQLFGDRRRR